MTRLATRARRTWRPWMVIAIAALVASSLPMSSRLHAHADSLAGSQGTDTSLPDDPSSAVTVAGRGEFSSLRLHVNETRDLVNQAVSVSWTGAPPTFTDELTHTFSNAFDGDYLQIFQCWGDPDPADPLNTVDPGPPPTQCQFGAESNNPTSAYPIKEVGFEYSRVLSQSTWSTYDTAAGWLDTSTNDVIEPFKAVDGTVVNQEADYNAASDLQNPKPFWQNPYFSFNTSNEVPFARDVSGCRRRTRTRRPAVRGADRSRGARPRLRPEPATRRGRYEAPAMLARRRATRHTRRGEPRGTHRSRGRGHVAAYADGVGEPHRDPPRLQAGRQLVRDRHRRTTHRRE